MIRELPAHAPPESGTAMEVLEKTQRKVVVCQRRHEVLRAVVGCFLLTVLFYLLDARHPKSSLYCTRHAVLPDNELEAAKGLHVEDIDCSLVVRPTRTALDLTFFGEISYSFEIVSARLVRPPKRPPDGLGGGTESCRWRCSPGEACPCGGSADQPDPGDGGQGFRGPHQPGMAAAAPGSGGEIDQGIGGEAGYGGEGGRGSEGDRGAAQQQQQQQQQHPHHSLNMGVNDVATLVLEDNQGITYDFYTFQDEAVAERMLEKVEAFIREARGGGGSGNSGGGTAAEQAPLELEVLYDDSWLDEMACGLFLVITLVLMTRPYVEVVEFDADSGAMALDRRNLFHCGVFRYSCALENVSKLEVTEADVYLMSAHAFEHLRQTKEFGLRVIFSVPLGGTGGGVGTVPTASSGTGNANPTISSTAVPATTASASVGGGGGGSGVLGFDAALGTGGDGGAASSAASLARSPALLAPSRPTAPRRRRWGLLVRRIFCWRGRGGGWRLFGGGRGWLRRPAARGVPSTSGGFMYLDLLFGKKELDDRNIRRPVQLVNDLLMRFASDVEVGGGQKKDGNCCVCFRRRSRVVTFPCMHMATCPQCSESLGVCPLCRASISEKHTVFL